MNRLKFSIGKADEWANNHNSCSFELGNRRADRDLDQLSSKYEE
jgi:hypothetical protein